MKCKICNQNETDSTTGVCWDCFREKPYTREMMLDSIREHGVKTGKYTEKENVVGGIKCRVFTPTK